MSDKTKDELVYAKDCSVETAKYEFEFVKKLYNKKDKRQYKLDIRFLSDLTF